MRAASHKLILLLLVLSAMLSCIVLSAQPSIKHPKPPDPPVVQIYTIKDGKQYVVLGRNITPSALDSFLQRFNLKDIPFGQFLQNHSSDSLRMLDWHIEADETEVVVFSKPLVSFDNIIHPGEKLIFKDMGISEDVPASLNYGYNKFKNKRPFAVKDSLVTFSLRNNSNAVKVLLAGSFTRWQTAPVPMKKTDSGWVANVQLPPGKHWYKFIVDDTWMADEDNRLNESDGMGNINSVYYKTNVVFHLPGYAKARKVYLAGSFNNWQEKEAQLYKTGNGWELPVYLGQGTHTYKFKADRQWITDEANKDRLPDGHGGENSVLRIGKPYMFELKGREDARQVFVAGTFNEWRQDELKMTKTGGGWELPYVLAPGNYEYKFVVDGKWVGDPANPNPSPGFNEANFVLIIEPNYTFMLQGFDNAKAVFVAGDFNEWKPNSHPMKREGNKWTFTVHLDPGKHRYKFIVDGEWILDPANNLWEQNEYSTGNSVLWIENEAFKR